MFEYTFLVDPVTELPVFGFITDGSMGTYVDSAGADADDLNDRLDFAKKSTGISDPSSVDDWMTLALDNMMTGAYNSGEADTLEAARTAVSSGFRSWSSASTDEGSTP